MTDPLTLRLPFHLAHRGFNLPRLLAADPGRSWAEGWALLEQFELSQPERELALTLLRRKTNLWLFRCNQRCFCGDFVVVDMSPPGPAHRVARVLELKQSARLNREAGGLQLQHHRQAVAEIAAVHGILAPDCAVELWLGDSDAVLRALGAQ